MPLSAQTVEALTPENLPPATDLPGEAQALDTAAQGRGPAAFRRFAWTRYLLFSDFSRSVLDIAAATPGSWYAGVGLVPWDGVELEIPPSISDAAKESGYVWGGLILVAGPDGGGDAAIRNRLSFEDLQFPIIRRQAGAEAQAMSIHDAGLLGTATCWGMSLAINGLAGGREGVLTAKHVVEHRRTHDLDCGTGARHALRKSRNAPLCIDAAFLEVAWQGAAPSKLTVLDPTKVAFGDPANFQGAVSNVSAFVTHVSAHAIYSGAAVPMLVCYDKCGQGGDSGSMVTSHAGAPLAIHLGRITLDSGGQESYSILLHQAQKLLGIELYG